MKIGKVSSWLLRVGHVLPLAKEPVYSVFNFIEVETHDGLKGHAMVRNSLQHGVHDFIKRDAAPAIRDMDPMRTEEVRERLLISAGKHIHGVWSCAASLIDIALWDIKGKATQQPIWKLLGGARAEVPVYKTFGLQQLSNEELVEVAKMHVKDGHKGLKMVVGAGNPVTDASISNDIARVRSVREAIGPNIDLMVDANRNFTLAHATRFARLCEPYNLTWFEDSVTRADPRLMKQLRQQTSVPLAAGSTGTSDLMYLREYLFHEAVDFLQPNVRDIGGYTQALKAAAMAQAFNVPLGQGGAYPHLNMHLHGGVPNGGRVEFHDKFYETVFDGTMSPANGKVTLPTASGLGLTPKAGFLDLAVGE